MKITMPKPHAIIETPVFLYKDLPESSKQKAREWLTGLYDGFDYLQVTDDWKEALESIGFNSVSIEWRGFYSQGDGACFDFKSFDAAKFFKAVREWEKQEYKPLKELLRVFFQNEKSEIRKLERFSDLIIAQSYTTNHHYSHYNCRAVRIELDGGAYNYARIADTANLFELSLTGLVKEIAKAIYKSLDAHNDYLHEESTIAETMEANEYTFTIGGKRFD